MELEPGDEIDRYVVEDQIGAGGVAIVYRVRHLELGTPAALKVLQVPAALVAARLRHEGRIQARLRHPNVVPVLDMVQVRGAPALLAEFVPGPSLGRFLARHRPTLHEADALARDVLSGIAAAHALGLIHRDVKPGNVLIDPTGEVPVARVTDFGLGKALAPDGADDGSQLTTAGAVLGTPRYMAPEQVLDPATADARADVFGLGALLYELVTGVRAFDTRTVAQVVARRDAPPRRPTGVPDRMADAVEAALRPDPADRPADASALLALWVAGCPLIDSPWTPAGREAAQHAEIAFEPPSRGAGPKYAPVPPTLLPAPSVSPSVSSVSPSGASSNPTWSDSVVRSAEVRTAVAPAAPRRWRMGLGLVGIAIAAFGASRWVSAPPVDGPPDIGVRAAQAPFDEGWAALRGGDPARARERLGRAAAQAPDSVVVHLVHGLALELDGDLSSAIEASRAGARALQRRPDQPAARLLTLILESQEDGTAVVSPGMVAWLEADRDWLGHVYAARYCPSAGVEVCDRVHAGLDALAPPTPLTALVKARAWLELGRADRARAAVASVQAPPPALRSIAGQAALVAGDPEAARAALAGLAGTSEVDDALAIAARLAGDDVTADRRAAARLSGDRPAADRIEFLVAQAEAFTALGRFREAAAAIEARRALEETPLGQIRALSELARVHALAERGDDWVDAVEAQLMLAARRPEVPDPVRSRLASSLAFAEGKRAAAAGDREGLDRALRSIEGADLRQPKLVARLALAAAVLEGDVDAVRARLPSLHGLTPCETAVLRGEALRRAGGGVDLTLDEVLPTCGMSGPDRAYAAVARVGRAEQALLALDLDAAAEEIRAFDALWPAPDADLAVVVRAEVVRARLRDAGR